ncbi:methyltransferase [Mesorhizobium yinganensis]|uniref:methyltransferase n=1 Tax=Mesorhizobium yinganensis TaxID=3157707 RepID=UPI0032B803F1
MANVPGFSRVNALVRGYQVSRLIEIACSLEVADRIGAVGRPISELAAECGADPERLERLLCALSAFGLFTVSNAGDVSHTEDSRHLRKDSVPTLHYASRYYGMASSWAVWGAAGQAMSGDTPFEAEYGKPYFDYLAQNPAEAAIFDAFMQHSPDDRHAAVVDAYDFSQAQLVVDVGGGNGALLAAILGRYPGPRGILLDQAATRSMDQTVFGAAAGRCTIDTGNFFDRIPAGGNIYTMSQILHDWNDARCLVILSRCREAIRADGSLLVIERVLDATPGETDPINFLADMHMMMLYPGAKERSLAEYAVLFRHTGFGEPRLIRTRSAFSIVETKPA